MKLKKIESEDPVEKLNNSSAAIRDLTNLSENMIDARMR